VKEQVLPDDYVVKPGDVIRSYYKGVNDGPIPVDDNQVVTTLYSAPADQIEDEVYRKTGVRIKIRNRNVEVVRPGYEYRYVLEYEVVEAHTPTVVVLAIEIIMYIVALYLVLQMLSWFLEKNARVEVSWEEGKFEANIGGLVLILVAVLLILMLLRR